MWIIARSINSIKQNIPSWTGFNISIRDQNVVEKSTIGYLESINHPVTEVSTCNEVLERSLRIKDQLNLSSVVCIFDQAMYAKICDVIWKNPIKFQPIVTMMGGFHTLMMALGVIGKRFGDAGLKDVLIQSETITEGSADHAISGKMYNRSIRINKYFFEALLRLLKNEFDNYLLENESEYIISQCDESIQEFSKELSEENLIKLQTHDAINVYCQRFNEYLNQIRTAGTDIARFWISYIDIMNIILNLIYATRIGDWLLYINSLKELLPWVFAYDRTNYARYLSVFLMDMVSLPSTHPEVYSQFLLGNFAVQMSEENPFGKNEFDKCIENTINKDTKTPGGITRFSTNDSAVHRWTLNSMRRADCRKVLHQKLNYNTSKYKHNDLQPSRIDKDEKNVKSIVEVLSDVFANPFTTEKFISISCGIEATANVASDLLNAHAIGKKAQEAFVEERLKQNSTLTIFDALKKLNLKTFKDLLVTKIIKTTSRTVCIKADRSLFARMLIIGQQRCIDLESVFSYPLGPIPWALAGTAGELKKTNKAAILHELEKGSPPLDRICERYAKIVDGMAVVQKSKPAPTFGDLACQILTSVMKCPGQCERIDIVFDVYWDISVKNCERERRSAAQIQYSSIKAGQPIKQWSKFLSSSANKTELIKCF